MSKAVLYALTYLSLTIMLASLIYILSVTFETPYQVPVNAVIATTVAFCGVLTAFILNQRRLRKLNADNSATELNTHA